MKASREKVLPHRKMGRPATGRDPVFTVRLSKALINRLDEWAELAGVSRSKAIRSMIESGLTKPPSRRRLAD
jgi:hypothetical protein